MSGRPAGYWLLAIGDEAIGESNDLKDFKGLTKRLSDALRAIGDEAMRRWGDFVAV